MRACPRFTWPMAKRAESKHVEADPNGRPSWINRSWEVAPAGGRSVKLRSRQILRGVVSVCNLLVVEGIK